MPKHDNIHFDQYSEQNRAKHRILSAYLPAYLTALKGKVDRFHYIDGFAGRGTYADHQYTGSPLLALSEIERTGVTSRTTISLVECNPEYFKQLCDTINTNEIAKRLCEPPILREGAFSTHLPEILGRAVYQGGNTATFAFVDPCGVEGVKMENLVRLLKQPYGEVLLFFNYDAVNRLIGGVGAGTVDRAILNGLFGTPDSVTQLLGDLLDVTVPQDREAAIRKKFIASLRAQTGARYFLPFRFEARHQDRTSHYLLHCSNHPLAFKIMKEVMWKVGRKDTTDVGKLEFSNDGERAQLQLFRADGDIDELKQEVLARLKQGPCQVKVFSQDWVCRPEDNFSERVYKKALLDLERDGCIQVFDAKNVDPRPVSSRRKHRGEATMGDDLWIRLIPR